MKRLQLVAQVFTNALPASATELSLRESEERLASRRTPPRRGSGAWITARASSGSRSGLGRSSGISPDERRHHAASRGVGPSRRLGSRRAPSSVRAARNPSTWSTGSLLPGDGRVRWIASRGASQFDVHRRAGPPDGRLHRHHRAQACRRGASRERGSPGGGSRPRRPRRSTRWTSANAPPSSTTGCRDLCGLPSGPQQGLQPWSSGWSICILTTASALWSSASNCTTAGWSSSPSSIATCTRPRGEVDSSPGPRRRARRHRTRVRKPYGVLRDITERRQREEACGSRTRRSSG